ncbi:hypothetical protein [Nocardia inohanensis]|uniref:hypothetical protein n=1 Tax=Nocardia inohanensis TaxID=209246 RepID=UPI000A5AA080|nr:hypothetical protein [Nocardia inohanensis]
MKKTVIGVGGVAAFTLLGMPLAQAAPATGLPLEPVAGIELGSNGSPAADTTIGLGSVAVGSAAPGGPYVEFGSARYYLGTGSVALH